MHTVGPGPGYPVQTARLGLAGRAGAEDILYRQLPSEASIKILPISSSPAPIMTDESPSRRQPGELGCCFGHSLILGRRFLAREHTTGVPRTRWVNGRCSLFDMAYDALLVHHERRAASDAPLFVENPVFLGDRTIQIAQQRKRHADLFGESLIGKGAINADAEHDGIGLFKLGHISLIGLKLAGSATGERKNIEC